MIAEQLKDGKRLPKKALADCITKVLTIFYFDGTSKTEDGTKHSQALSKVAKAYGFKEITKIGIDFELEKLVFDGHDKDQKTKTLIL